MPAHSDSTPAATGLRCFRCGGEFPFTLEAYTCPRCGDGAGDDPGILDVLYDYDAARDAFPRGEGAAGGGVFRWRALLPVPERMETLPAGGTPLVPAPRLAERFGLRALYLKDETRNPTRALKDRATAVALQVAAALGHRTLYCASAGNAAISLAGFCAHAGLECRVHVPARASPTRLGWLRRFGAEVRVCAGDYDLAYSEAEAEGRSRGGYSRNCAFNPLLVEGKKTAAFEIAEQLGWKVPDLVLSPVGDGCTLGALGKGFRELARMGRTDALPRLVGVQAEGVQPLTARFHGRAAAEGETRATSIAVRRPRNALRLLSEVEASGGTMLAAPDHEMEEAARLLAREGGVAAELTSAATLAGLARLAAAETLEGRTAVLVVTGGRIDGDS